MWKLLLGCMTPNKSMEHWCQELTDRRIRYEQLRQDHLRFIFDSSPTSRRSAEYQELRQTELTIRKDCTRTFSYLLFFKSSVIQDIIVRLLLVFVLTHPEIGYKQGMTDLLAILLLCVYCDRWRVDLNVSSSYALQQHTQEVLDEHLRFQSALYRAEAEQFQRTLSTPQRQILACLHVITSNEYVEHDCFILLESLFAPLQNCYVASDNTFFETRMDQIITLTKYWDPTLITHLESFEIVPSMFLLRWLRLLICREFHLEAVLYLWDRLLIRPHPDFPAIPYLCTSMLLGIGKKVKACDSIPTILSMLQEGLKELNVCTVWELTMRLWGKYEQVDYGETERTERAQEVKTQRKGFFQKLFERRRKGPKKTPENHSNEQRNEVLEQHDKRTSETKPNMSATSTDTTKSSTKEGMDSSIQSEAATILSKYFALFVCSTNRRISFWNRGVANRRIRGH